MKRILLVASAAAAFIAAPAIAQPQLGAGFTRADVESRVRNMFARVDVDRDGYVTEDEARAVQPAAPMRRGIRGGPRGGNREAQFARLDADGNGVITRSEFLQPRAGGGRRGMRADRGQRGGLRLHAFARLDSDRDGRVSLAEATSARLRAFERLDMNRDGRVTPDERRARRAARQADRG